MHQADIAQKDINKKDRLSVLLLPDSLFCASFDHEGTLTGHTSFTGIRYADPALADRLSASDITGMAYPGGVYAAVFSRHHFSVPRPEDSLVSLFPGMEHSAVKRMKLPGQDICHYFDLSTPQENLLNGIFGSAGYKLRSVAGLLASHYIAETRPILHLHLETNLMAVYASLENRMVFYNHFEWTSPTDILYYAQSVMNSSGLTPETCKVKISGWVEQDSQVVKLLSAYFPDTSFADDFKTRENKTQLSDNMYFMHYINIQCV